MTNIYRADVGSGETVICLHGIGSSSTSFALQIEELSSRRRVVAWDAPGYGQSDDPTSEPDLAAFASAAAGLIREASSGPVHLVGVSWGGVIAARVAIDYPDLVRCLVLIASSPGSGATDAGAENMRGRASELQATGARAFANARAPRLLSDQAPDHLVQAVAESMRNTIRLPGYGYAAESMAATNLMPDLHRISAPTLVLVGDEDKVTGPAASRALAEGIPDAVLVTVRGAGHLVNQERPEAVNAWVSSYLDIIEHLYSRENPTQGGDQT